jgi:nucleolar protein 4
MSQLWPSDEQVQAASEGGKQNGSNSGATIFVRNLAFSVTDEQLSSHFEDIGPIKHAFIARNRHTNGSNGFGFVEFAAPSDAATATRKFDGAEWFGRALKVEIAMERGTRPEAKDAKIADERKEDTRQRNREKRQEKSQVKAEIRRIESEMGIVKDGQGRVVKQEGEEEDDGLPKRPELPADVTREDLDASSAGRVLVVSGFTMDVPKDRILASMKRVAPVQSILYPAPESLDGDLCARITFETKEAALKACKRFNGKELRGCKVRALVLQGVAGLKASRLIVRNVAFNVTEAALAEAFEKYGRVLGVSLPRSEAGHVRGFAFVQMDGTVAAERALALNGSKDVGSRQIVVDWALSKEDYKRREALEAKLAARNEEAAAAKKVEDTKAAAEAETARKLKQAAQADASDDDDDDAGADADDAGLDGEDGDEGDEGTAVYPGDSDEDGEYEGDDGEDDGEEQGELDDDEEEDDDDAKKAAAEKAAAEKKKATKSYDVHHGCTLFIRNLSYDTTEDGLFNKFSQFGRVKLAKVVRDRALNRSMGTAFVQFHDRAVADGVMALYGTDGPELDDKKAKKDRLKRGKAAQAAAERVLKLDSRDLIIARAVDRGEAADLAEANKKKKEDRRNMYLAREGVILADTSAADGVSKLDLEKRTRAWKDKKTKLQNPNFSVSRVRLSVRNIPLGMDEKMLKTLFLEQVKSDYKKADRKAGDVVIKQAKVVFDKEKLGPDGLPKSKGYGFVEFSIHEHALHALRAINNNPTFFRSANKRPIVEFALDDARKVLVRKKMHETIKTKAGKMDDIKAKAAADALAALGRTESLAKVIEDTQRRKAAAASAEFREHLRSKRSLDRDAPTRGGSLEPVIEHRGKRSKK